MNPTRPWRIGQIDLTKDWLHFKMPSPQSLNGEPTLYHILTNKSTYLKKVRCNLS